MIDRVAEFLKKYELQDKTLVVGFSGGFDSMCLLHILSCLNNLPDFAEMKIIAAHYNHNWRGEESLREQEVCKIFANSLGITFYTQDAPATLRKTENDARIARYEFFGEAKDEFDADAVLTAHNKDDNAETVLYRIIKGTGIVGLQGIAEKRSFFYRPLLNTKRAEIVEYCSENHLTPNNDSSNSNTVYRRNFLRLNVIPLLEKINENIKESLNTLALNARNDNEIIEEYMKIIRPKVCKNDGLVSSEYANLSKPVKLRILYEYIQNLDLDYDYKKVNEIYDFIENNINQRNGSTISLASAMWLYADNKVIETIPHRGVNEVNSALNSLELEVPSEGEYQWGDKTLVIQKCNPDELFVFPDSTSNFAYADFTLVKFPLTIRTRKDGDIITPFGMLGSMKLKKYLNSKGVPRHRRDELILLCDGEEVLWAAGIGISNKIGVKTKPTHVIKLV